MCMHPRCVELTHRVLNQPNVWPSNPSWVKKGATKEWLWFVYVVIGHACVRVRVRVRAHRHCACASEPPVRIAAVWVFQGCGSYRGLRQVCSQQTEESDYNPGESQSERFWGGYEQAIQPNNVHAQ